MHITDATRREVDRLVKAALADHVVKLNARTATLELELEACKTELKRLLYPQVDLYYPITRRTEWREGGS